ncbi:hypothetical protein H8S95_02870 [Pontibacter sp. KCTC 32443]|uniref:hypothetical protein n=1 Tax=Pontibacter TaxID=323449 RepID=UPI00164D313C|nr:MULTISPECIES: hypothetical protein [Pontibacter]MBC5772993.1 hypothetical protein [Pontibacter sp. KCTC 32443]
MGLKNLINKVKQEADVLKGEASKDKQYTNQNTYPDEAAAKEAFELSRHKLFDVNRWSALPGINSTFELFDEDGNKAIKTLDKPGYYIRIDLPGPTPENWVHVTELRQDENMAEFVVHPSTKPQPAPDEKKEIKHFFAKEASSTFRVERNGNTLIGYEIGRNEAINNQGEEAGDRALANTLIAEGGWAGVQKLQWDKLTAYLVNLEEAEPTNK